MTGVNWYSVRILNPVRLTKLRDTNPLINNGGYLWQHP